MSTQSSRESAFGRCRRFGNATLHRLRASDQFAFARDVRRRALWTGALPGFVCRATIQMRTTPTLEAGVRGAFSGAGPLADRVPRLHGRPPGDLLGDALEDVGPHAQRIEGLLTAAPTANDHHTMLDRAVETALDGTQDTLRTYATSIQGPITAIYAFGVVLPLALVGILPAAPVAGLRIPMTGLAIALDVVLPAALIGATGWLVAQRPVVKPPPTLPAGHPAFGSTTLVVATALVALLAGVVTTRFLPGWTTWFICTAWPLGAVLLARYQPALPELEDRYEIDTAVPDLLAILGDAMADGAPPEHALEDAAALPGMAGEVATDATDIRQRLTLRASSALVGAHGPLAVLDGHHTRTLGGLIDAASEAGGPGGRALSRYATHLDALQDLETGLRSTLARLTDTLRQTAACYAPAIAGVTVALATRLQTTADTLPAPTDGFALVVGGYVLVLAIVLPAAATAVTHGWCRVRIGVAAGRALLLSGAIFPIVAQFVATLL